MQLRRLLLCSLDDDGLGGLGRLPVFGWSRVRVALLSGCDLNMSGAPKPHLPWR